MLPAAVLMFGGLLRLSATGLTTLATSLAVMPILLVIALLSIGVSFYLSVRYLIPIMNEYHAAFGEPTHDISLPAVRRNLPMLIPTAGLALVVAVLAPDAGWAVVALFGGFLWRLAVTFAAAIAVARSG
jgi:hypothetical protein